MDADAAGRADPPIRALREMAARMRMESVTLPGGLSVFEAQRHRVATLGHFARQG
jgi:hypothetical protein